ncbi:metal-dependent transcriptional regulator [Agathobaculum sp.]|uniref:metal-dependent transcriptional regulator n=1 Tax=Agathobaculum sp. TaxID=2048138 RepID=UPI001C3A1AA6|nr:metal-dependent transcriptional regulator [Agathobaculum sp.]MBS6639863.1 metal-dependent transcriptional regulator [Clostridiaceae bacterium]HIX11159.1 metal-dependent transcriptional regulator [Candidatus Agathobaculum pullistercoris]
MKIQESAENYLEAILILMQKNGQVRSIDVAHYTGFSKPSISRAVGLLRDNGYVSIDQNGLLGLTEAGLKIAETIYERHTVLTDLLTKLGVSPETAAEDACRIEHVISAETFDKLKEHVRKYGALAGE